MILYNISKQENSPEQIRTAVARSRVSHDWPLHYRTIYCDLLNPLQEALTYSLFWLINVTVFSDFGHWFLWLYFFDLRIFADNGQYYWIYGINACMQHCPHLIIYADARLMRGVSAYACPAKYSYGTVYKPILWLSITWYSLTTNFIITCGHVTLTLKYHAAVPLF